MCCLNALRVKTLYIYQRYPIEQLADLYKACTTAVQSVYIYILEALLLIQVAVRRMVFIPALLVVLCLLGPRCPVARHTPAR